MTVAVVSVVTLETTTRRTSNDEIELLRFRLALEANQDLVRAWWLLALEDTRVPDDLHSLPLSDSHQHIA